MVVVPETKRAPVMEWIRGTLPIRFQMRLLTVALVAREHVSVSLTRDVSLALDAPQGTAAHAIRVLSILDPVSLETHARSMLALLENAPAVATMRVPTTRTRLETIPAVPLMHVSTT